jgi:hypothetical protein
VAALACVGLLAASCSSNNGGHDATGTTVPHHAATTSTASTVPPPATTTTTGIFACTQVSATPGQTQGAAGTIIGTITLSAVGSAPCTVLGYPALARFSATGAPVPVSVVHGLTVNLSGPPSQPASQVTLSSTQQAEFTFQYSDVPTGSETVCASSTTLSVTTPGATSGSTPVPLTMAPCNNGTIEVSPIYAAPAS